MCACSLGNGLHEFVEARRLFSSLFPVFAIWVDWLHITVVVDLRTVLRYRLGKAELWHPAHQKPLNRSSPNLIHVITSWVPITKQNLDAIRPGVSSHHYSGEWSVPSSSFVAWAGHVTLEITIDQLTCLLLYWFFYWRPELPSQKLAELPRQNVV